MSNVENLQRMIDAISMQPVTHHGEGPIYMGTFVERNECGTTACLAGWANILRQGAVGKGDRGFSSSAEASEWMGLEYYHAYNLFHDFRADDLEPEDRTRLALQLLEDLKTNDQATWTTAARKLGIELSAY